MRLKEYGHGLWEALIPGNLVQVERYVQKENKKLRRILHLINSELPRDEFEISNSDVSLLAKVWDICSATGLAYSLIDTFWNGNPNSYYGIAICLGFREGIYLSGKTLLHSNFELNQEIRKKYKLGKPKEEFK